MLSGIIRYREFIMSSVKRSFAAKYKGSVLGAAWSAFQPLSLIFIYTLVFSKVMKSRLVGMETAPYAYSIYLCSGVLTWNFFADLLSAESGVFIANANMIKKISFPRITLPVIAVCSSFINFAIGFSIFLLFLLAIGQFPWSAFPAFFMVIFAEILFCVGLGVGLGVMNVFFRDVRQMVGIALQFWFWATPVVYPVSILPDWILPLLRLNPMFSIVESYHDIFLYGRWPDFVQLFIPLGVSVVLCVLSLRLYHRHAGEMVDEL